MPNDQKQYHSRSYHRYFEGYAEKSIPDDKGGYRIERIYVGNYYRIDLPDRTVRARAILILLLYVLAAVSYLIASLLSAVSANRYVAILTMLSLICMICMIFPVISQLTAPREMEIRAYRDSALRLRDYSLGTWIILLVCAIGNLLGVILCEEYSLHGSVPSIALYLISAALICAIYILGRRTPYKVLPPRNERPSMSSPIRYEAPE